MKFEEALVELRKGKSIKCISFENYIISLSDLNELSITFPSGISGFTAIDFIIKGEWNIVQEPGKSFPELFEAFKSGKRIRRKDWDQDVFLSILGIYFDENDGPHIDHNDNSLSVEDILSTDWEIIY